MNEEIERAIVSVQADVTSAIAGLNRVGGALDGLSMKANKSSGVWSGFTGGLAKSGLALNGIQAIVGIATGAISSIEGMAKGAAQLEYNMARLEKAITNTGVKLDANMTKKLEQNIERMEQASGYSKAELIPAFSTLVAITGNYAEATNRFALAQDFARGTGLELSTATRLLGKVTDETVTVLARYGIHVEKGTKATELLRLVQQKFGGQSAVFMNSALGAWAKYENKMEDLQVKVGKFLIPVAEKLLSGRLLDFIGQKLDEWGPSIEAAVNQAVLFFDAMSEIGNVLTGKHPGEGKALRGLLGDDGAVSFMKMIADVRVAFKDLSKEWSAAFTDMNAAIKPFFDGLGDLKQQLQEVFGKDGGKGAFDPFRDSLQLVLLPLREAALLVKTIADALLIIQGKKSLGEVAGQFKAGDIPIAGGLLSAAGSVFNIHVDQTNNISTTETSDAVQRATGDAADIITEGFRQGLRRSAAY